MSPLPYAIRSCPLAVAPLSPLHFRHRHCVFLMECSPPRARGEGFLRSGISLAKAKLSFRAVSQHAPCYDSSSTAIRDYRCRGHHRPLISLPGDAPTQQPSPVPVAGTPRREDSALCTSPSLVATRGKRRIHAGQDGKRCTVARCPCVALRRIVLPACSA